MLDYFQDEKSIQTCVESFGQFLTNLQKIGNVGVIHLIAHSMGNRALVQTFQLLKDSGIKFGHVILAAPDVGFKDFESNVPVFESGVLDKSTTIYLSRKDRALEISAELNWEYRLGQAPPQIVYPSIQMVDVSFVDMSYLGHGYVASNFAVLRDMQSLLLENKTAEQRANLTKQTNGVFLLEQAESLMKPSV
jgi:esterase/lipase superfamily enzyme